MLVASTGDRGGECVGVECAFISRGGDMLERSMAVESERAPGSTDNARKVNAGEVGEEEGGRGEGEPLVTHTAGTSGWDDDVSGTSDAVDMVGFIFVVLSETLSHTVRTTGCWRRRDSMTRFSISFVSTSMVGSVSSKVLEDIFGPSVPNRTPSWP